MLPLLRCPKTDIDNSNPFYGDVFNRKNLADSLTNYIDRLALGGVIAIDAPWGSGKTWFGKNWKKELDSQERKTLYIDAFEQDYIDDPFVLLSSELMTLIKGDSKTLESFKEKAIKVSKATASTTVKILASVASRAMLGGLDIGKEFNDSIDDATKDLGDLSSKWIDSKFEEYEENKKTISAFKQEIQTLASKEEKPIVILIDELDRCKPDFAVRLLERIKHFFDVPNIVFVLLINREQLESAIKGVYGTETNASAYLGKFINFFFKLPMPNIKARDNEGYLKSFIVNKLRDYKFYNTTEPQEKFYAQVSLLFDLSLRDIEDCIGLFAFAYEDTIDNYLYINYVFYLIAIKQYDYKLFNRLINGEKDAHQTMIDMLQIDKVIEFKFDIFKEWHEAYLNDFNMLTVGAKIKSVFTNFSSQYNISLKGLMPYLAKKIDLPIL